MDPTDIASAFGDRDANRAEIALRSRRRSLESREFRLLSFISGVYAYTTFGAAVSGLAFIALPGMSRIYGLGLLVLTVFFAFAILWMWRRKTVSPWLIATPIILVVVLSVVVGGWKTIGFGLDLLALGAVFLLARLWREKAAIQAPVS